MPFEDQNGYFSLSGTEQQVLRTELNRSALDSHPWPGPAECDRRPGGGHRLQGGLCPHTRRLGRDRHQQQAVHPGPLLRPGAGLLHQRRLQQSGAGRGPLPRLALYNRQAHTCGSLLGGRLYNLLLIETMVETKC